MSLLLLLVYTTYSMSQGWWFTPFAMFALTYSHALSLKRRCGDSKQTLDIPLDIEVWNQ